MTMKPLTDDEVALIRYILATEPPGTEPVPPLLTDSLRRIVESANPADALRHEYRNVFELALRLDAERR
jgi:hypothetical protein